MAKPYDFFEAKRPKNELSQSQRHTASSDFIAGPFGIGDMGPEAYAFADFLRESDQTLWQVMPLGPSGVNAAAT